MIFCGGASSSAFQIEGAYNEDGKGISVADYNSFLKSDILADTKVASDFYHQWEQDIELMRELGIKTYRFSISWTRIIPDGDGEINEKGLEFYHKIIDRLIEYGILPFITLYHFDLPFALVEKYNGWESRDCIWAFLRYAEVCFQEFGQKVKYWQVHNEQNLMVRVKQRMNLYKETDVVLEKKRIQMDYHMCLAHALTVAACHKLVPGGKIGPAVSSSVTYPVSCKTEDVYAARLNDNFKVYYLLDMHYYGEYPGYYLDFLETTDLMPERKPEDCFILKSAKMDFIAVNYYRSNCAKALQEDANNPYGKRTGEVDFNLYGFFQVEKNPNLLATEYGASIDPLGLRIALNEYWQRYHLPLIITENGLGSPDILEGNQVHDFYRIDYLEQHINMCRLALEDGVNLFGYCPWSMIDLLSSSQGFNKRYGFVYVRREEKGLLDLKRIKKDSFYWYQNVIKNHGINNPNP